MGYRVELNPADPSWEARPYQADSFFNFNRGKTRQILIWHRRAGKDAYALNLASRQAQKEVGSYWHLYPTHVQARRAIFEGISKTGVRFLDQAFPAEIRKGRIANRDMMVRLKNGSTWQLCGSDRYNSLVGSNPKGIVFSEWALCDPRAWDYVRPIIRENGGWVVFITTYRTRNHAWKMVQRLQDNPDWYVDVRSVLDTTDGDGNRILDDQAIEDERAEGMSEALIQQEYFCNPMAALPGAVYGSQVEDLQLAGRLDSFVYDASRPVVAAWSTEFDDQYTVSFWQTRNNAAFCVGSASFPFTSIPDALDQVEQTFPWRYINRHILAHNTPAEIVSTFESRAVVDLAPGVGNPYAVTREKMSTWHIDNAPRGWTNGEQNNERLVDALNGYRFVESDVGAFKSTVANTWEKYYARSAEVFAAYQDDLGTYSDGWYSRPSTDNYDARVI